MEYLINGSISIEEVTAISPQYNGYPETGRQPALHVYQKTENELVDCIVFDCDELPKTREDLEELWLDAHSSRVILYADRETLATIRGEDESQNRQVVWDEEYEFPVDVKSQLLDMLEVMDKRLDSLAVERVTLLELFYKEALHKNDVDAAIAEIIVEEKNLKRLRDACWKASQEVPGVGRAPKRVRRSSYLSAEEMALIEEAKKLCSTLSRSFDYRFRPRR